LHEHDTEAPVEGLVIANDVDRDRCNLLLTRTRTGSNLMVTNYEAQLYPSLKLLQPDGSRALLKIDRILCDVPCSGDGTMRKNPDVWQSWHIEGGVNVHPLQVQILSRACQLLIQSAPRDQDRERIVYSTCSLNPLEDEAVVATILQRYPQLRLIGVEHVLPGLRRQPGLTQWRVQTRTGEWYDSYEALLSAAQGTALQSHIERKYLPSMFPPKDVTGLNLHHWYACTC
jgi:16S rRNA C967 or C1407 C5-methylase (RsmB/RsmF family)